MNLTSEEKLQVLKYPIDVVVKTLEEAKKRLQQAQDDYCIMNSCDGDRSTVKKPPILSVCDGAVSVDLALKTLKTVQQEMFSE